MIDDDDDEFRFGSKKDLLKQIQEISFFRVSDLFNDTKYFKFLMYNIHS